MTSKRVYRVSIGATRLPELRCEDLIKETQQFYYTYSEGIDRRAGRRSKDDYALTPAKAWENYLTRQENYVRAIIKQLDNAERCLEVARLEAAA